MDTYFYIMYNDFINDNLANIALDLDHNPYINLIICINDYSL